MSKPAFRSNKMERKIISVSEKRRLGVVILAGTRENFYEELKRKMN